MDCCPSSHLPAYTFGQNNLCMSQVIFQSLLTNSHQAVLNECACWWLGLRANTPNSGAVRMRKGRLTTKWRVLNDLFAKWRVLNEFWTSHLLLFYPPGPIVRKSELLFSLPAFNHPDNMLRPALKTWWFIEDKSISNPYVLSKLYLLAKYRFGQDLFFWVPKASILLLNSTQNMIFSKIVLLTCDLYHNSINL
jgi:hypothetical protein